MLNWLAAILLPFTLTLPLLTTHAQPVQVSSVTITPIGPETLSISAVMSRNGALGINLYPPGESHYHASTVLIVGYPGTESPQAVTVTVPGLTPEWRPLVILAYRPWPDDAPKGFDNSCVYTTYAAPGVTNADGSLGYYGPYTYTLVSALDQPIGKGLALTLAPRTGPPCNYGYPN